MEIMGFLFSSLNVNWCLNKKGKMNMANLVLDIDNSCVTLVDGVTGEILANGSVFYVADYICNHFEDGNFMLQVI